jgi:putative ABC transport system permease protein
MALLPLILKSLRRNVARSAVTGLALVVLVMVGTLIGAVFVTLDQFTTAKAQDLRMVVKSRWRLPSRMPLSYVPVLRRGAAAGPGDVVPDDWMAWQFYAGTIDPVNLTPESGVFCIAVDPRKLRPMMEDLENLDPELVDKMLANRRAVLMGREQLEALNKRVGERVHVTGLSFYKGIDLDLEIVGQLPDNTYDATIMNWEYLNSAFEGYEKDHFGVKHPADRERTCLVWLKVRDADAFRRLAAQIESCSLLTDPPLECQTPSADIAARLGVHRDLLWMMKWLLTPAVFAVMMLVVANATGISVGERRTEIAVLKVVGFPPRTILLLVTGEAMLVGGAGGLLGAGLAVGAAHAFLRGADFLFVPELTVPLQALAWGPAAGVLTALLGSLAPALSACHLKVADVFARVT